MQFFSRSRSCVQVLKRGTAAEPDELSATLFKMGSDNLHEDCDDVDDDDDDDDDDADDDDECDADDDDDDDDDDVDDDDVEDDEHD
ncbi:unnamed protein product, partial [Echinostoma caproni]|uniref:Uncharacterized protein n=1 Tax=Echinostoma caproni TaxID=27848 RepID=A0A183ADH7_9TREM